MTTRDFTHDLAIVMNAFYVGEIEAGGRSCERILSEPSYPAHIQESVHKNQPFYIQPLSKITNVTYQRIDVAAAKPDWKMFNPSLVMNYDKPILNVRNSNYRLHDGQYITPPEDRGMIKTENVLYDLGNDGVARNPRTLKLPDYRKTGYLVDGMEDVRLFFVNEKMYASGTVRNVFPKDWLCRIGMVEVDPITGESRNLQVFDSPFAPVHEKNWMPISGQEVPRWLYDCGFHGRGTMVATTWEDSKVEITKTHDAPFQARKFRGGTQLIRFDGGYICLIHEVHDFHGPRVYSHKFVRFDEEFRVKSISKPFALKESMNVEFAAGLIQVGGEFWISFGVRDVEPWIVRVGVADVLRLCAD